MTLPPVYSLGEQIANSVTHGLGVVLSIAGLAVLAAFATLHGDAWHVVGVSIFGATLILLYTASTLYHALPGEKVRQVLRTLDHSAIFLLIAGTYTPFLLVNLRGPWGWSLLAVVWVLGLGGILLRFFLRGRGHGVMVAFSLAMAWMIVVAIVPMFRHVATGGLLLLALGGVTYTVGVIFYRWKRLPYNHAIWHGFVLAGSAFHYFAILFYVIPWPENSLG